MNKPTISELFDQYDDDKLYYDELDLLELKEANEEIKKRRYEYDFSSIE